MREFEWTAHLERLEPDADCGVLLGIGDDAALLASRPDQATVVSTDTLNEGVHFLSSDLPELLGHKSLAVSLSDLAAMGATPAWALCNLTLPTPDSRWMKDFQRGFNKLLDAHAAQLVGGDTTRGPLSITWTVIGHVAPQAALRRDGAQPGERVWVSGCPGLAAEGLVRKLAGDPLTVELDQALHRPSPRLALGQSLAGVASACIDVSDGLVADLGHLCRRSGLAATLDDRALPGHPELDRLAPATRRQRQWAGGDDYELCFTAPASASDKVLALSDSLGLLLSEIGTVHEGSTVRVRDESGKTLAEDFAGHEHFAQDRTQT